MPDRKKVTVMCYFGSDNALSPLLISQLKAIKDAGYEPNTNVIVRFDPYEASAPTRIYNVNAKRREAAVQGGDAPVLIGDAKNPFVRNMAEDIINAEDIVLNGTFSQKMKAELTEAIEPEAVDSLRNFIGYCIENHPAEHYILLLIGHGMIVGNDAFLPDDNPNSGVSLVQLKETLSMINGSGGTLELLGLHSCSMSSVEIAYQLKGVTNYLIASQGLSYVGSCPYRQLLKKTFATVNELNGELNRDAIQELVEKFYLLSLYNSTDFMMAGYSSELALCNLQPAIIDEFTRSFKKLTNLLMDALATTSAHAEKSSQSGAQDPIKDLIVSLIGKAHSESQSYWGESYTDLYDFCDRLLVACKSINRALKAAPLEALIIACTEVKDQLETSAAENRSDRFNKLVVRSEYFGWQYQFSHGLSIYFPWSEPLEVRNVVKLSARIGSQPDSRLAMQKEIKAQSIMDRYKEYEFTSAFKDGHSWCDFLNSYFNRTQRELRNGKPPEDVLELVGLEDPVEFEKAKAATQGAFLDHQTGAELGPGDNKPTASIGIDGGSSSIKNFSTQTGRNGRKIRAFSISPGALKAFKKPVPKADYVKAAHRGAD
jgi:hypothetical protein